MAENTKKNLKKKSIIKVNVNHVQLNPSSNIIWFDKKEELAKLVDFESDGVVLIDKEGTEVIFVGDMIYVLEGSNES